MELPYLLLLENTRPEVGLSGHKVLNMGQQPYNLKRPKTNNFSKLLEETP